MKRFKYWIILLLLTFGVTISAQLFFRLIQFFMKENGSYLEVFNFIFSAFVLPAYLLKMYNTLNKKLLVKPLFAAYAIILFICILISAKLGYSNWLATTQYPIDAEDRDHILIVLIVQFGMALGIAELGLLAEYHYQKTVGKKQQNSPQ